MASNDSSKSFKRLWLEIKSNEALVWANTLHKRIFWWAIAIISALFVSAVAIKAGGYGMWNVAVALGAFIIGTFCATKPEGIAAFFAGNAVLNGFPNIKVAEIFRNGLDALPDFKLKEMFRAGIDGSLMWVKIVAYAFYTVGVTAIFLVYVPIDDKPVAAFLILAVVIGFGVYSLLFTTEFVWFKKATKWILIGGLAYAILLVIPAHVYISYGASPEWFTDEAARKTGASILVSAAENRDNMMDGRLSPVAEKLKNGQRLTKKDMENTLDALKKADYTPEEHQFLDKVEKVVTEDSLLSKVLRPFGRTIHRSAAVTSLADVKVSLPNGKYRFTTPGISLQEAGKEGPHINFHPGAIVADGIPSGGIIVVRNETATLGFVVPKGIKGLAVQPNVLSGSFEPVL